MIDSFGYLCFGHYQRQRAGILIISEALWARTGGFFRQSQFQAFRPGTGVRIFTGRQGDDVRV
jgi:hypothetical protein